MEITFDLAKYQAARNAGDANGRIAAMALYNKETGFARLTNDIPALCRLANGAAAAAGYDVAINPLHPFIYREAFINAWHAAFNGLALCMVGGSDRLASAYCAAYQERATRQTAEWLAQDKAEQDAQERAAAQVSRALRGIDTQGEPEPVSICQCGCGGNDQCAIMEDYHPTGYEGIETQGEPAPVSIEQWAATSPVAAANFASWDQAVPQPGDPPADDDSEDDN